MGFHHKLRTFSSASKPLLQLRLPWCTPWRNEKRFTCNGNCQQKSKSEYASNYLTLFPPLLSWLWSPGKGPRAWLWLLCGPGALKPRLSEPGTFWWGGPWGFRWWLKDPPWLWLCRPGFRIPCWRGAGAPLVGKWRLLFSGSRVGTGWSPGADVEWPERADLDLSGFQPKEQL